MSIITPTPPRIDLGVILPPRARQIVYVAFVALLFVAFLLDVAIERNPEWLATALRVLDVASPFVLMLAAVNTPTGDVVVPGRNATAVPELGTSNEMRHPNVDDDYPGPAPLGGGGNFGS